MDKKTELKSQLRGLSRNYLEGNFSGEELVKVRQNMKGLIREILDISRQENCGVNLRTAGLEDDESRNYFIDARFIFRDTER